MLMPERFKLYKNLLKLLPTLFTVGTFLWHDAPEKIFRILDLQRLIQYVLFQRTAEHY